MQVGILGGGQLGRMLALAGYPLGVRCMVYDSSPDARASEVAPLLCASHAAADALSISARAICSTISIVVFGAISW